MNKLVFITGATSGIGLALAKKYLNYGYKVAITGRTKDNVIRSKEILSSFKNFVDAFLVDVTNEKAMQDLINKLSLEYAIDTVIANAGISAGIAKYQNKNSITNEIEKNSINKKAFGNEYDLQSIHNLAKNIFNINVFGVFNTVHPVINIMKKQGFGKIVLISSMSAFFGMKSAVFYASSKAAIKSYGEGLGLLLKKDNISVITVCPGFVESNITKVNNFKMPFFMDSNKAADIILRSIIKGKKFIVFPKKMYFFVYLISILPFSLRNIILNKMPNK